MTFNQFRNDYSHLREELEERAALIEFGAVLDRNEAERQALRLILKKYHIEEERIQIGAPASSQRLF